MPERVKGVISNVCLITISSFEQHGYEGPIRAVRLQVPGEKNVKLELALSRSE